MIPNNPFLISGYHSPEYFCDRKQETAKITDGLHNGRNITLIAPRRMGKTGLIRHTFQNINNQDSKIITLYMDIFSTQSLGDFVKLFANTVLGKLDSNPKKALNRITRFIRSCRPIFTIDELTGIPKVTIDVVPSEEENTLKEIFDYLASSEKRCYIAIDEFQQISEYPEQGVEALLRSYTQFVTNVNFIFAGSKKHIMQEMFTSSKRPFYQSSQIITIDAIEKEEYANFAIKHFSENNITLPKKIFDNIYDKYDGHTWYIQVMLNRLY
jgi:AAA+ ATPase superfamily predicted ATPase